MSILEVAFNVAEEPPSQKDLGLRENDLASKIRRSPATVRRIKKPAFEELAAQICRRFVEENLEFSLERREFADDELVPLVAKFAQVIQAENGARRRLLAGPDAFPVFWAERQGAEPKRGIGGLCALAAHGNQLIMVGGAGSGKTTVATMMVERLLAERGSTGRVAVKLSLGSWKPDESIWEWTARRLGMEYPKLMPVLREIDALDPSGRFLRDWILPVFDGFEEIPKAQHRKAALTGLHKHMREDQFVLTCREEEFRSALAGVPEFLPEAFTVAMLPVDPLDARAYLIGKNPSWESVLDRAERETGSGGLPAQLHSELRRPLMLWLAASVYPAGLGDPNDLLDPEILDPGSGHSVEEHLLSSLALVVFERNAPQLKYPFDPDDAIGYLSFLARRLDSYEAKTIAWWQLHFFVPRVPLICGAGAIAGLVSGLLLGNSEATISLMAALALGSFFGFGFGRGYSMARMKGVVSAGRNPFAGIDQDKDPELTAHAYRIGGAFLGVACFTLGALAGTFLRFGALDRGNLLTLEPADVSSFGGWLFAVGLVCMVAAFATGYSGGWVLRDTRKADDVLSGARAATPSSALKRDGFVALGSGTFAAGYCAVGLWGLGLLSGHGDTIATAPAAALTGVLVFTAWARYRVAHAWLSVAGRIPKRYMTFLDHCHQLGLFQPTGLAYDFRHRLLCSSIARRRARREDS